MSPGWSMASPLIVSRNATDACSCSGARLHGPGPESVGTAIRADVTLRPDDGHRYRAGRGRDPGEGHAGLPAACRERRHRPDRLEDEVRSRRAAERLPDHDE